MKVYVVWSVVDYEGLYLEKIFLNENDAVAYCSKMNSKPKHNKFFRYDSYEVF